MKFTLLFLIGFLIVPSDLQRMREQYLLISKSEKAVDSLLQLAQTSTTVDPDLRNAYRAAALITSAKYKFSPISKFTVFNEGRQILETSVRNDSASIEARYIRLTIQQNAPAFLGYNQSIKKDRLFLIMNVAAIRNNDSQLYSSVAAYLLAYCDLSPTEKKFLSVSR